MIEGPRIPLASEAETSEKTAKYNKSMLSAAVRAVSSHQQLTHTCTIMQYYYCNTRVTRPDCC